MQKLAHLFASFSSHSTAPAPFCFSFLVTRLFYVVAVSGPRIPYRKDCSPYVVVLHVRSFFYGLVRQFGHSALVVTLLSCGRRLWERLPHFATWSGKRAGIIFLAHVYAGRHQGKVVAC